jgi:NADP-dependent 3-hydroxy acid dehydrogenase YdfG
MLVADWPARRRAATSRIAVASCSNTASHPAANPHVRRFLQPAALWWPRSASSRSFARNEMIDPFYEQTEVLAPDDIADGVAYMVTRPRHTTIGELWIMPTDQV